MNLETNFPKQERPRSAEEMEIFARQLQTEIKDCAHDGEVIDLLVDRAAREGRTVIATGVAMDVGVFAADERASYQKLFSGLATGEVAAEVGEHHEGEPNLQVLQEILAAIESVTTEEIEGVAALADGADEKHPVRQKLRDIIDAQFAPARELLYKTNLHADFSARNKYPQFWPVLDKLDTMFRAVGWIVGGVILHERSLYKKD